MSSIKTKAMNSMRMPGIPRFGFMLELSFLLVALAFLICAPGQQSSKTLALIFTSIILEAFPFMLFGTMVGGLVEIFVSRERMTALLPKKYPWLAVFIAAGMGMIFPVCECAVVPVVRRLARKGLPTGAAVAYLIGGPIVNPIVTASTALAYKFDMRVVLLRLCLGYLIAVFVGLCLSKLFGSDRALRADLLHTGQDSRELVGFPVLHNNKNKDVHCDCGHHHDTVTLRGKFISAFRHAADDFLAVGHFLVIGAFIAALAQTYINRNFFLGFADYFALPSMLMMALAIMLNLCSEADAFIAASFRGLMPLPAQLAFLLTGPMFDLKLLLMYQTLFRKRAIAVLAPLILLSVFLVVICLELIMGGNLP